MGASIYHRWRPGPAGHAGRGPQPSWRRVLPTPRPRQRDGVISNVGNNGPDGGAAARPPHPEAVVVNVDNNSNGGAANALRPTALLLALLLAALPACRPDASAAGRPDASGARAAASAGSAAPAPSPAGKDPIHFAALKRFAPDRLLDYSGAPATASTSNYGAVKVSELERTYRSGERTARLRILDTSLHAPGKPTPPALIYEDDERLARPVRAEQAVGFVEYHKRSRLARADLVVGGRFVVTVSAEDAIGPEEAERLVEALDLKGLAGLASAGR